MTIPKLMLEACQKGQIKVVQLLLERYYNSEEIGLNIKDRYGRTPFMEACSNGHKEVVQLLLDNSEKNIDLNARSYVEGNAFNLA